MRSAELDPADCGLWSPVMAAYATQDPSLGALYRIAPNAEGFADLEQAFPFSKKARERLVSVLEKQHSGLSLSSAQQQNLAALKADAYTVCTGHQLVIGGGPLFMAYKALTTIRLAEVLSEKLGKKIVPIFWLASEDHDVDEIRSVHYFRQDITWPTEQTGPVGHFDPREVAQLFADADESLASVAKLYESAPTLSAATRQLLQTWFSEKGLLILDADEPELKAQLAPIAKEDLLEGTLASAIQATNQRLEALGHEPQAHVREVNFFLLSEGKRERLERSGEDFVAVDSGERFTRAQMTSLIEQTPERLSPNVLLRPMYQQAILPNVAYIGGPGELAYWLQLRAAFDQVGVPFPQLVPRQHYLLLDERQAEKLDTLGVSPAKLFQSADRLRVEFVEGLGADTLEFDQEAAQIDTLFQALKEKAQAIDASLEGFIGAEAARAKKQLEGIEKRVRKALEQRHQTKVSQLLSLQEKLVPGGSPQERHDSVLETLVRFPRLFAQLLGEMDPYAFQLYVRTLDR